MPELPEVETVRVFLENNIVQKKTLSIKIENKNLRFQISQEIPEKLHNEMITKILRRGKFLIFLYSNKYSLLLHLGMTGYFRISNKYSRIKHDHIKFFFKDKVLVFNDIRKFGFIKLYNKDDINSSKHLINLGPDAMGENFSINYFCKNKERKTNIKNLLMNQNFVSGLGNIYCSEILFDAKINPSRCSSSLKKFEIEKIIVSAKKILKTAINMGGTTIKNFIVSDEKIGYFKNRLMVYGRENLVCIRCKNNNYIKKIKHSGRSTFFCSVCQL